MQTASTPTTIVSFDPLVAGPERLALAGFLAGYSGQTREAYGLDLRQFLAFCHVSGLALLKVRRADIEIYARTLDEGGPGPPSPAACQPWPGSTATPRTKA